MRGLNQPCTGEVKRVAHLGYAWSQMYSLNHCTASDALGFKTILGDTHMA